MSFEQAYSATLRREGGYKLHDVAGDRGGMTYAGISRRFHPRWPGWEYIDRGATPPTELVRSFYRTEFWIKVRGDELPANVAQSVYDFAVNTGVRKAIQLMQLVIGVEPDGVLGPKTLAAARDVDPAVFAPVYALAKLKRYADICTKDPVQKKFLLGWVNRLLDALQ